jgi:hypothetical protein
MEKKHDLIFCTQCGLKLDGDEVICPSCGYKLAELHPFKQKDAIDTPPPSIVETPVTAPPPVVQTPPVVTPPIQPPLVVPPPPPLQQPPVPPPPKVIIPQMNYQQPVQTPYPQRPPIKKGMGAGWIIAIILLGAIILGGCTVAFLQYNGNINIEALRNIIPSKEQPSNSNPTVTNHTRYYVVQSFAIVDSKWTAFVSDIVISKSPYNNEEGAKNAFKKAMMVKHPTIYDLFTGNIIVHKYNNLPDAEGAHASLIKSYDAKHYDINTISFGY